MNDRFIRGGIAGVAGMVWLAPWNLFSYHVLHFSKGLWGDIMSRLVLGHVVKGVSGFILSLVLLAIWNAVLGVLFVRVIIPERDGNYVLRAIGFAFGAWFALYSLGTLYKIPGMTSIDPSTAYSNWIGVTGWAIITGWLTGRWDSAEAREKQSAPAEGAKSQLTNAVAGLREAFAEFSGELGELGERLSQVVEHFSEERRETESWDRVRGHDDSGEDERPVVRLHRSEVE